MNPDTPPNRCRIVLIAPPALKAVTVITSLFTAAICAVLAWYTLDYVLMEYESPSMAFGQVPAWLCEAVMPFAFQTLFPYLVTCSTGTKDRIGQIFGLDAAGLSSVQSSNDHWFTAWGDKFDLGKELDAKRSREVY